MAKIKKILEVDFFFDPKPLTKKEKEMISDFIKADKERRLHLKRSRETSIKQQPL